MILGREAMIRCSQLVASRHHEVDVKHVRKIHEIDKDISHLLGRSFSTLPRGELIFGPVGWNPLEQLSEFADLTDQSEDE